jgi:hypothetical protein
MDKVRSWKFKSCGRSWYEDAAVATCLKRTPYMLSLQISVRMGYQLSWLAVQ